MKNLTQALAAAACSLLLATHSAPALAQAANQQALLLDQVKAQLQEGKTQEALQTAQQLQAKAPADYRSHYYLALAHMGLQRYPEAQAAAERALQLAPANARAAVQGLQAEISKRSQGGNLIAQAEQAYNEGLTAKAARLFDQAWQASPQQPELGMRAALLYLDPLNQVLDAGRVLWQVAQAHPGHPLGKTAQDRLTPLQGQLDAQARQWIEQAQTQDPSTAQATLARAQGIAPRMPELLQARARLAARGSDSAALQAAIKDLVRAKQAQPRALGMLPGMQRWLQDPAFAQFMADLLGDTLAADVTRWADPAEIERERERELNYAGDFVRLPGGSFIMGSPASEPSRSREEGPQRQVAISAFWMGRTEVTQGQWRAVMGNNPSGFSSCGDTCPVERVSWDDIQQFLQKLNQLTGQNYRLPTEAEWEYAARAGCTTPFNLGGQCRNKVEPSEANFDGNFTYNGSSEGVYRKKTLPVGSFAANGFGLHDMHGNVWEWVKDCYADSYAGAPSDGSAVNPGACSRRVLRGGSWGSGPQGSRAADRGRVTPGDRFDRGGFRLARTAP
ncbi:SUMF1/EgtB/PvdO family nonheme iron enzyme [Roseateles sp.]|uniref:SUMF1/EgtB/PvdO family nonheme iron enzyme n=1 Tax=Roseateles sp. TaxID=1971397 RepID=UPI003BA7B2C0